MDIDDLWMIWTYDRSRLIVKKYTENTTKYELNIQFNINDDL